MKYRGMTLQTCHVVVANKSVANHVNYILSHVTPLPYACVVNIATCTSRKKSLQLQIHAGRLHSNPGFTVTLPKTVM